MRTTDELEIQICKNTMAISLICEFSCDLNSGQCPYTVPELCNVESGYDGSGPRDWSIFSVHLELG